MSTHPRVLRRMLDRLPRQEIPDGEHRGQRPLAALTTRENADPAIALLDGCAVVADVMSFYQQRIAEEGFLPSASERRSLLELARSVGYELAPGVAAGAWLAFEIDDPPGASIVPQGTQVLSIPGQDEQPQTFETGEELAARAAWNVLRPASPPPVLGTIRPGEEMRLQGTGTELQPGDPLLVIRDTEAGAPWFLLSVTAVRRDQERDMTRISATLVEPRGADVAMPAADARIFTFRRRASLFGHDAPLWSAVPEEPEGTGGDQEPKLPVSKDRFTGKSQFPPRTDFGDQWPGFRIRDQVIDLDATYPRIVVGSRLVLINQSAAEPAVELLEVGDVSTVARSDFHLVAKVTRIEPDPDPEPELDLSRFGLRETVALCESEELEFAAVSCDPWVSGDEITLEGLIPEPPPGRALIFCPMAEEEPGSASPPPEVAFVESAASDGERTVLKLRKPLRHSYPRAALVIYGNAVHATHGETTREVLGSGDASRSHQRFALRLPPLTHVAAAEGGVKSTLEVRVNDLLWQEMPTLCGLGPQSPSYTVRTGDDGVPILVFGDGVCGARLPTGQENVVAAYRRGSGPEGNVAAGSLALLQTRPLGVRAVTNPLPATGGVPPDDLERARANTPRSVQVLGRLVSLKDYEAFAQAFPGIGKAVATLLWSDEGRLLHLTVAGVNGAAVPATSALHRSLRAAVEPAGASARKMCIDTYRRREFRLTAKVRIAPRHHPDAVVAQVRQVLASAFSFESRDFGQGVAGSEIVAVIQGVSGVAAVDLDELCWKDGEAELRTFLDARPARFSADRIRPAELVLPDLRPGSVTRWEVAP